MPTFDQVPMLDAELHTGTGKRAAIAKEYMGYINQLQEGQAGRLQPLEGETVTAVKRRLGTAAKLIGKELTIKRTEDSVYFWLGAPPRRRRRVARDES